MESCACLSMIRLAAENRVRNLRWQEFCAQVRGEEGPTGGRIAVNVPKVIQSFCVVYVMNGEPNDHSGMVANSREKDWKSWFN